MPRVKFVKDYTVKAAGGETYHAGQVVELSPESARHFIDRRIAVEDDGKAEHKTEAPRPALRTTATRE